MRKFILFFAFLLFMGSYAVLAQQKTADLEMNPPQQDSVQLPAILPPAFTNYNFTLKARLDSVQKTVPLPYNEYVQGFIDIYSKRKDMMGKMLGLSQYYFPIFEKALSALQIPAEIKYLPIIESALDPHAVSRVGATGLWQFMFGTAKAYGLQMDNFVDERKDPIQASYAAAAYFRDAYDELGDWLLAIAAYNCGKGNVTRAMEKADSRDFWEIRRFLPKETRDYVPAFIAALYVMKFADKHDIPVQQSTLYQQTDTVQVSHFVSLPELSQALGLEENLLFALNPGYKKKIVNGTPEAPRRIILPQVSHQYYAALYELLNNDTETDKRIIPASTDDIRELKKKNKPTYLTYKVKTGDTLTAIAGKFKGASVVGIKAANGLKKSVIQPGMLLKILSL